MQVQRRVLRESDFFDGGRAEELYIGIRRVCLETLEVDFLGGRYTRFVPGADSDYVYARPFAPKITRHDITLLRVRISFKYASSSPYLSYKSYIAPLLLPVVAQSLALIKSYEEIVCPITKSRSSQDKCGEHTYTTTPALLSLYSRYVQVDIAIRVLALQPMWSLLVHHLQAFASEVLSRWRIAIINGNFGGSL